MPATVKTPVGNAPVVPIVILGIGMYLAWFGVHYWDTDTKWPTDPLKAVLTGKSLPAPSGQTPAPDLESVVASAPGGTSSIGAAATGGGPNAGGPAPAHSGNYSLTDLEALWTSQGGSGQTAFAAANVAIAESSGNPNATSTQQHGTCTNVGLWQLAVPCGVGAGFTIAQLKDPATNARLTIMHTANGTNWQFWADAVVKNGVYVGPKV
jgi:Lysozyme like domain